MKEIQGYDKMSISAIAFFLIMIFIELSHSMMLQFNYTNQQTAIIAVVIIVSAISAISSLLYDISLFIRDYNRKHPVITMGKVIVGLVIIIMMVIFWKVKYDNTELYFFRSDLPYYINQYFFYFYMLLLFPCICRILQREITICSSKNNYLKAIVVILLLNLLGFYFLYNANNYLVVEMIVMQIVLMVTLISSLKKQKHATALYIGLLLYILICLGYGVLYYKHEIEYYWSGYGIWRGDTESVFYLLKNAAIMGQSTALMDSASVRVLVANDGNPIHTILYHFGWIATLFYFVLQGLFLYLSYKCLGNKYRKYKSFYFVYEAIFTYFLIRCILGTLYSFGIVLVPIDLPFSGKGSCYIDLGCFFFLLCSYAENLRCEYSFSRRNKQYLDRDKLYENIIIDAQYLINATVDDYNEEESYYLLISQKEEEIKYVSLKFEFRQNNYFLYSILDEGEYASQALVLLALQEKKEYIEESLEFVTYIPCEIIEDQVIIDQVIKKYRKSSPESFGKTIIDEENIGDSIFFENKKLCYFIVAIVFAACLFLGKLSVIFLESNIQSVQTYDTNNFVGIWKENGDIDIITSKSGYDICEGNIYQEDINSGLYYARFEEGGKIGIINLVTGEIEVDAIYDEIQDYNEDTEYLQVCLDNKWGCLDMNFYADAILPCEYDYINPVMKNATYIAAVQDNTVIIMDMLGTEQMQLPYVNISEGYFENTVCVVEDKEGYKLLFNVDTGEVLDFNKYSEIYVSESGYIIVQAVDSHMYGVLGYDNESGLVYIILEPSIVSMPIISSDGVIFMNEQEQLKSYCRAYGWNTLSNVDDVLESYGEIIEVEKEGYLGFMDGVGNLLIEPCYMETKYESEYGYLIGYKENGSSDLLDLEGNIVVESDAKICQVISESYVLCENAEGYLLYGISKQKDEYDITVIESNMTDIIILNGTSMEQEYCVKQEIDGIDTWSIKKNGEEVFQFENDIVEDGEIFLVKDYYKYY